MAVVVKSGLAPLHAWVFDVLSGTARIRYVVPLGRVTEVGDTTFTDSDPAGLDYTVTCYPDTNGVSMYRYSDDGVTTV
jgi:hypothetical protein